MKWCPKCDAVKPLEAFYKNARNKDGRQGYCVPCWKEKVREWQEATPERYREYWQNRDRGTDANRWRKENREARQAHRKVARALKNGVLVRPEECTECGGRARIEAHHHDYDLPYDVTWLCTRCHRMAHRKEYVRDE